MTTVMHGLKPAQARKLNEALLQIPTLDAADLLKRLAAAILGKGSAQGAAAGGRPAARGGGGTGVCRKPRPPAGGARPRGPAAAILGKGSAQGPAADALTAAVEEAE